MHSFQGGGGVVGGVKFMADVNEADIPLLSALEFDELEWFASELKP